MLIKDWLGNFIRSHQARHARDDWPREETPESRRLWSMFMDEFREYKVTHKEAETASRELNGDGIEWVDDHLWNLVKLVHEIRERPKVANAASVVPASLKAVSAMADDERTVEATRMLDEFYTLGWRLDWREDEEAFVVHRDDPNATPLTREFSARMRELDWEIYALMGHPKPVLDPADFRTPEGKLDWRAMVRAIGSNGVVETDVLTTNGDD